MKPITIVVFSLLIASCASVEVGRYSDVSDEELEALLFRLNESGAFNHCKKTLPVAEEVLRRDPSNLNKKASKNHAEVWCAIDELRWSDAYTAMVQYEENLRTSMGSFGFTLAHFAHRYEDAVVRLEELGRYDQSNDILEVDPEGFWRLISSLSSEGRKDLKERAINAMVKSPYFESFKVSFRSELARRKLRSDAKSGNFKDSDKWISGMINPTSYISMLSDKKLEPIWADLEAAVGENFVDINKRHVDAVTQEYLRDFSDDEAYMDLAHALVFAGRFQEAIDFIITPEDEDFPAITEDEAWALNMKVSALDAVGRRDEAEVLFEKLATMPVTDDNKYWLISFTINRADRLAGYGKWEEAIEAAEYAENFSGNAYAKMLIRRIKVCAYITQGKNALDLLNELYENREDSYVSAATAMMCSGDDDAAVAIMLEALEDGSGRTALQDPRFSFYVVRPEEKNLHELLEANEELRTAFEKKARLIPEKYLPLAQINSL